MTAEQWQGPGDDRPGCLMAAIVIGGLMTLWLLINLLFGFDYPCFLGNYIPGVCS